MADKFRTHKESEEDRLRCEWNLKAARDSHDALSRDNQKLKLQLAELQEKYAALQQKEGWWRKFAVGVETVTIAADSPSGAAAAAGAELVKFLTGR